MQYFTADTHFGHTNIIYHTNRPFKNTNEMDNKLIDNFNSIVGSQDDLYIIGDYSMVGPTKRLYLEKITRRLIGHKHLILGNHDRLKPFKYIDIGFESVHTSLELHIPEIGRCLLNHDPSVSCMVRDWILLCGHVHDLFRSIDYVINVGVDVWDFKPVSISQIEDILKWTVKGNLYDAKN